jgi:hypothetical protein
VRQLQKLVCGEDAAAMERWGAARMADSRSLVAEHWPAVEVLAQELLRRQRVPGALAMEIIDGALRTA